MSYLTASLQTSLLTSLLATAVFSATDAFQQDLESGIKLYQAGKYTEAEPKFRSAVEQAAELDPVDPRVARAWNNLAATIYALGRYDEAGQYYRKVLDWHDAHGMKTTLEYAKILNNVASMYRMTARFDEAAGLAARAIAIGEKVAPPAELAGFLHNSAEIERGRGNLPVAEALATRALAESERAGEDTLTTAHILQSLAMLRMTGGVELQRRATKIFADRLSPDHPWHASAASNLGQMLVNQGQFDEAKPLLERALESWRSSLGDKHPNVAVGWNNLARYHMVRKEFALAEPMLRKAIEIWESSFGTAHPDYAKGLYNLGSLFQMQGKSRGAEELFRRALAAAEPALGPGSPQTRQIMEALAGLYESESRETEASQIRGKLGFLPE
jgi:tetratricopeptide (TPR) repeat protein